MRLVRNGGGVDVLWTLARLPGMSDELSEAGLAGMELELRNLQRRHTS